MRHYPQHEDLGLDPEADRTEDLRSGNSDAARAGTPAASEPTNHQSTQFEEGNTMMTRSDQRAQCVHCTVPTNGGDTCSFCANYTPPMTVAQQLDAMVNLVDLARIDGNKMLRELPRDTGLFAVVDIVTALNHLRQAACLLDKAADALETDAQVVTR